MRKTLKNPVSKQEIWGVMQRSWQKLKTACRDNTSASNLTHGNSNITYFWEMFYIFDLVFVGFFPHREKINQSFHHPERVHWLPLLAWCTALGSAVGEGGEPRALSVLGRVVRGFFSSPIHFYHPMFISLPHFGITSSKLAWKSFPTVLQVVNDSKPLYRPRGSVCPHISRETHSQKSPPCAAWSPREIFFFKQFSRLKGEGSLWKLVLFQTGCHMCGEDGLPASPGYLADSLLWSETRGAAAASESHRQKPHKEIKDVIGRGRRKCSFSCLYSSEGKANRNSCTGPWASRMTFGSFCLFEICLEVSVCFPKEKNHHQTQSRIKHDRKTSQRHCCCFTQAFFPALHLQGSSKRDTT